MVANTGISKRYHRHERIGEGGMGEIFRAQDTQTGEDVALKVLKGQPSAESMQRFAREGQALRQLDHPNIVKFLDAFEDDGQQVLVLEYVPGGSLRQLLSQQGPLGVEQTLRISLELADALSRAHLLHIIHRDIKPANILLAADGTPRLTDFGIAYMADSPRMTDTGATVGTIGYLSPEACRGETLGPAADIWSFGIVLWEMLTGQTPFEGRSIAATLNAVLSAPLPDITRLRDDLPPGLVRLLMHMLDKDPAQRLNSTRQVGANIETLLAGDDPTLHLERHQTPQPRSSTTQPALDLPRHNLPAQTTPFIGRETELATVAAQLGETRLLTLVGPGGMGKTRLALVAAEQAIDHYADGVYFVALAPLSLPDNIISAIADAIGYEFYGALAPNQQLQDYLREKKMMLVMDNFEHLIQAAPLMTFSPISVRWRTPPNNITTGFIGLIAHDDPR
ncbi:MAG: protein kinase domain-containing protein [Anaerolineales bacterium]